MQHQLLQVLQQRPAGAVHHAFGETGGATGVHDVKRVVERQATVRWNDGTTDDPVAPEARSGNSAYIGLISQVWDNNHPLDLGNALADFPHPLK
jgi:hypothetical protein